MTTEPKKSGQSDNDPIDVTATNVEMSALVQANFTEQKSGITTKVARAVSLSTQRVREEMMELIKRPVPEDEQACLLMMQVDLASAMVSTSLYHWHIGYIADTMITRDSRRTDEIVDLIANALGRCRRTVQTMLRVYRAFTMDQLQIAAEAGLEYSDIQQVARLDDPAERETLIEKVGENEIPREQLKDTVDRMSRNNKKGGADRNTEGNPDVVFMARMVRAFKKAIEKCAPFIEESGSVWDRLTNSDITSEEVFAEAYPIIQELQGIIPEYILGLQGMDKQLQDISDPEEPSDDEDEPTAKEEN